MGGQGTACQVAGPAANDWLQTAAEWEPLISGIAGLVTVAGVIYALFLWLRRERREASKVEAVVNNGVLEVANRSSRTIWGVVLRNEPAPEAEAVNTPVLAVVRPDELGTYTLEAKFAGAPTIQFQVGGGDRYLWTPRCGVLTKCKRGPTRREHLLWRVWPDATAHIRPQWRHLLLGRDGEGIYRPNEDFKRHTRDVERKQRWDPRVW